jgi:hypothetical protein
MPVRTGVDTRIKLRNEAFLRTASGTFRDEDEFQVRARCMHAMACCTLARYCKTVEYIFPPRREHCYDPPHLYISGVLSSRWQYSFI